ncbi:hypothetical protein Tco_1423106 [Tanacetum coccineum]
MLVTTMKMRCRKFDDQLAGQSERCCEKERIKRKDVECRERDVRNQEYRQRHDDIRFYLQPYDHLTGDARLAMEELRAEIKAKYDLPY